MAALYDITGRLLELAEMAGEEDVEEEVLRDTFEAVEGEFDAKVESYLKVIKNIQGDAEAIDAEIKRLSERKKKLTANIDRMKATLKESMTAVGKKSAGTAILGCSIRKNGGKLPLIVMCDPSDAPVEFQKVTWAIDNDAVRKALDEGQQLEFACYGERGESLVIK